MINRILVIMGPHFLYHFWQTCPSPPLRDLPPPPPPPPPRTIVIESATRNNAFTKQENGVAVNRTWLFHAVNPYVKQGQFYYLGLTLIREWISNHMPSTVWYEITYPFPNFNGSTVEVWKWLCNLIAHSIMNVITYPCWDWILFSFFLQFSAQLSFTMKNACEVECHLVSVENIGQYFDLPTEVSSLFLLCLSVH